MNHPILRRRRRETQPAVAVETQKCRRECRGKINFMQLSAALLWIRVTRASISASAL
jgi:hypothetical protein